MEQSYIDKVQNPSFWFVRLSCAIRLLADLLIIIFMVFYRNTNVNNLYYRLLVWTILCYSLQILYYATALYYTFKPTLKNLLLAQRYTLFSMAIFAFTLFGYLSLLVSFIPAFIESLKSNPLFNPLIFIIMILQYFAVDYVNYIIFSYREYASLQARDGDHPPPRLQNYAVKFFPIRNWFNTSHLEQDNNNRNGWHRMSNNDTGS